MDRTTVATLFDHILDGYDIPAPARMLKIGAKAAADQTDPMPYSLLTNLAHAVMWQAFWLKKLSGGPRKSNMKQWVADWRVPPLEEFEQLRANFIGGLAEARRIASAEPFDHKLPSDEEAVDSLVRIAVHGTYHLGQMNLLKRAMRLKVKA